jgi:hypothetical protein
MDAVKLQLMRQYQRLPLDDRWHPRNSHKGLWWIRGGNDKETQREIKAREKDQRQVKPFPLARAPASIYLIRNYEWPSSTAVLTWYTIALNS